MDSADVDSINLALLALRCGAGAVMLAHGINHIFGGGKIAGTARWFASLGMKPGILHAWVASITEVIGGALLVVGLLTPFAGAAVIGVMLVAIVTNHRGNGFFIFRPGEGWEYVMTLTIVGFAIATLGAGEWSLDNAADLWQPAPGRDGLLIALVAGVGGAAALLAGFWRPEKKPAD
jgi:putative oxidoreductase